MFANRSEALMFIAQWESVLSLQQAHHHVRREIRLGKHRGGSLAQEAGARKIRSLGCELAIGVCVSGVHTVLT